MCGRVEKAPPAGDLASGDGEHMDPFALECMPSVTRSTLYPAEYGDVLAGLDELLRLEDSRFGGTFQCRKKVGHLLGVSPPSGVRQSRRNDALPIDFRGYQMTTPVTSPRPNAS